MRAANRCFADPLGARGRIGVHLRIGDRRHGDRTVDIDAVAEKCARAALPVTPRLLGNTTPTSLALLLASAACVALAIW